MNNGLLNNKKAVAALAGLLIVVFHLWVSVFSGNSVELFIRTTSYIGVDIFFFLSAYSLGSRKIDSIPAFYLNRLKSVYAKFAFFALIQALLAHWSVEKLIGTLVGYELVTKGGGSFLWFLPAIMLLYLMMPFYQRLYEKGPMLTAIGSFLIWFAVALLLSKLTHYRAGFILWNRLPIFLLAFLCAKIPKSVIARTKKWIWTLVLILVGIFLLVEFGFRYRLQVPIWNMFYVLAIPAAVGLTLLVDCIPPSKYIDAVGSSTLEMYGVQMVVGYPIAEVLLRLTGSAVITNLVTVITVIAIAVLLRHMFDLLYGISARMRSSAPR